MIIVLKKNADEKKVEELKESLIRRGLRLHMSQGLDQAFLQLLHLFFVRVLFQYNDHVLIPPIHKFRQKNRCLLRANTGLFSVSFNSLKDFMK